MYRTLAIAVLSGAFMIGGAAAAEKKDDHAHHYFWVAPPPAPLSETCDNRVAQILNEANLCPANQQTLVPAIDFHR